jgi:hypothetical protein
MSKIKDALDYIEKYAIAPPPPPGEAPAKPSNKVPSPGQAPASPGSSPMGQVGNSKVAEMQKAMQNLAFEVTRDSTSKTLGAKPQFVNKQEGSKPLVAAKKGFNDFIAEQYLGTLDNDKRGVEWTTNKAVTSQPGKQGAQSDPYELDVVMNTMQRIGAGSKEFQADGNWGFRTDNGLRNMLGFAYALLQLDSDFGLGTKTYSLSNWQEFQKLLSGYQVTNGQVNLPPQEKAKRAEQITTHLNAITKLYHDFRLKVTANPNYRPLLEGDRGYEKYDRVGTSAENLSPEEESIVKNPSYTVPGLKITPNKMDPSKSFAVPLSVLESKDAYLAWMKQQGVSELDARNIFNTQIVKHVNGLKG